MPHRARSLLRTILAAALLASPWLAAARVFLAAAPAAAQEATPAATTATAPVGPPAESAPAGDAAAAAAEPVLARPAQVPATSAPGEPSLTVLPGRTASFYPPPPPTGVYRLFSLSAGIGPGALRGPGERTLALSYNVIRLGIGIARNVSLVVGVEGARTPSVNPLTGEDSTLQQTIWMAGAQAHVTQRFYARLMFGRGAVKETTAQHSFSGGEGMAIGAAFGRELVQTTHLAIAVEVNGSTTRYEHESWQTAGLHLVLSAF